MKKNISNSIFVTFAIGLILSFSVFYFISQLEQAKIQNNLELNAKDRLNALSINIERHIDTINALASLFIASDFVSRKEFHDFSKTVLDRNPSIYGLSWNPMILDSKKQNYIDRAVQDGIEDFKIIGLDKNGKKVPNINKEIYIPVYYIEPYLKNKPAVGFDISSHQGRKKAIDLARDSGNIVLTKRIRLIQKRENSYGYLMLKAIYEKDAPVDTVAQRNKHFKGLVVGVFDFEQLISMTLQSLESAGLHILLSDISSDSSQQLLYHHFSRTTNYSTEIITKKIEDIRKGLHWAGTIDVLGRQWSMLFSPSSFFTQKYKSWNSFIFLIIGFLITILLVLYLISLNKNKDVLEEEVRKRTHELEIVSRAKSDFLANMSHEIRTPLNGIVGFIDMLYKKENNPQKQIKLQAIKESSSTLLGIINDILDFSKIEMNKLTIEKIPLSLKEIFIQTVELYFDIAKNKNIFINLTIDENVPSSILGDSTRIKQILSNLLSNAIKFAKEDTKVIVNLNYLQDSQEIFCEVIDEGVGIEVDKLDKVFKSFEQADSSTTRKYGGTGLGLSITKKLVKLMDGKINVESEINIGSKFYFTIPIVKSIEVNDIQINHDSDLELSGKILIAEDNKTNQLLLSMLLDDLNLEYDIVDDGSKAVESIKNQKYNLILMDQNMPVLDGTDATKIIRNLDIQNDIPIIAVTANALKGDKEKFLEVGMNEYISKPIDALELETVLKKYLTKKT